MTDRELDALVVEKIMGWYVQFTGYYVTNNPNEGPTRWRPDNFYPTLDISAAWEVVEKMGHRGAFAIEQVKEGYRAHWPGVDEVADTAPRAICLAALLAVGVEVK